MLSRRSLVLLVFTTSVWSGHHAGIPTGRYNSQRAHLTRVRADELAVVEDML